MYQKKSMYSRLFYTVSRKVVFSENGEFYLVVNIITGRYCDPADGRGRQSRRSAKTSALTVNQID
jgi:hypothetical protein